MPVIRALTLMVPEFKNCSELMDGAKRLKHMSKSLRNVWTLRISVSGSLKGECLRKLVSEGFMVSAYHSRMKDASPDEVIEVLREGATYVSLRVEDLRDLSGIHELLSLIRKALSVEALTRVAFSFGGDVETPYYPLSTPRRFGVSAAIRYADALASRSEDRYREIMEEVFVRFSEAIEAAAKKAQLPYLGLDASLSPWMDESVVPIIMKAGGLKKFPSLGAAYSIRLLNEWIGKALIDGGIPGIGFNEVMLPVGEDNVLKKLASEGTLRLRDLTLYSAFCVAGVDMVNVPDDPFITEGVGKDLLAAASLKGRPVGMRLIPSPQGDIAIKAFGHIPQLKP